MHVGKFKFDPRITKAENLCDSGVRFDVVSGCGSHRLDRWRDPHAHMDGVRESPVVFASLPTNRPTQRGGGAHQPVGFFYSEFSEEGRAEAD
jgi:hypothetical protein